MRGRGKDLLVSDDFDADPLQLRIARHEMLAGGQVTASGGLPLQAATAAGGSASDWGESRNRISAPSATDASIVPRKAGILALVPRYVEGTAAAVAAASGRRVVPVIADVTKADEVRRAVDSPRHLRAYRRAGECAGRACPRYGNNADAK